MKTVREIIQILRDNGVKVNPAQVSLDIRLNRFGIKAQRISNLYVIDDDVAEEYVKRRIEDKKKRQERIKERIEKLRIAYENAHIR